MVDTKHTLGPWKANQINQFCDFEIIAPDRNSNKGYMVINRIEGLNAEANACLIAAAPELLEALKDAETRGYFDPYPDDSEMETDEKEAAKAAITKAESPNIGNRIMKHFKFIVHLVGEGKTENEAWDNAVKRFTDPKNKWQAHCSCSIEYENKKELLKNLFRDKSDEYMEE